MREQITKSLERAAATLTPGANALGVTEITVPAANGKSDAIADEVVRIVSRFGGSATKGLQDNGRMTVLVDLPPNREQEFRVTIQSIGGESPASTTPTTTAEPGSTIPATTEKKSFVVQIVEQSARSE
jgi:hypothetical protein